jgi:hypothetical protein
MSEWVTHSWLHATSQQEGSTAQSFTRQGSQARFRGAPTVHRPWGHPQSLQSAGHEWQSSAPSQTPFPQVGPRQQSPGQLAQLSPAPQTSSPQAGGLQQSAAQPAQLSPASQTPFPQAGSGQQSTGQVLHFSPP